MESLGENKNVDVEEGSENDSEEDTENDSEEDSEEDTEEHPGDSEDNPGDSGTTEDRLVIAEKDVDGHTPSDIETHFMFFSVGGRNK